MSRLMSEFEYFQFWKNALHIILFIVHMQIDIDFIYLFGERTKLLREMDDFLARFIDYLTAKANEKPLKHNQCANLWKRYLNEKNSLDECRLMDN